MHAAHVSAPARLLLAAFALAVVAAACGGPAERTRGTGAGAETASEGGFGVEDLVEGGPPPDGIPAIDEPRFVPAADATFLTPQEPVIALEIDGDARAYPLRILLWHEIANDTVGGTPVAVTYCPLCNTPVVFERPTIDGELLDFGTSGKLLFSNLVMYDRQTNSLWPQATGEAIDGPLDGRELELVPAQIVAWRDFLDHHPDGKVLSQDTGFDRPYGENPYGGYDRPDTDPFLFDGDADARLPQKARVLGVVVGEERIAFPYAALQEHARGGWAVARANLAGDDVVVFWKAGAVSAVDETRIPESRSVGATGAFRPEAGGRELTFSVRGGAIRDDQTGSRWSILGEAVEGPLEGARLPPVIAIDSFWFDWAAFYPGTRIWAQ